LRDVEFIHISKTGGDSLQKMLKIKFKERFPQIPQHEICFSKSKPENYRLTLMREPYSHVFSMYLECRYDGWGERVTNNTGFPRSNPDFRVDFLEWLRYFAAGESEPTTWADSDAAQFGCYNPWNFQTRFLVCEKRGHLIRGHGLPESELRPDPALAIANLKQLDHFGTLDNFDGSWCEMMVDMFGDEQNCTDGKNGLSHKVAVSTHGVPHHSVADLSQEHLDLIDRMTAVDRLVYGAISQPAKKSVSSSDQCVLLLGDSIDRYMVSDGCVAHEVPEASLVDWGKSAFSYKEGSKACGSCFWEDEPATRKVTVGNLHLYGTNPTGPYLHGHTNDATDPYTDTPLRICKGIELFAANACPDQPIDYVFQAQLWDLHGFKSNAPGVDGSFTEDYLAADVRRYRNNFRSRIADIKRCKKPDDRVFLRTQLHTHWGGDQQTVYNTIARAEAAADPRMSRSHRSRGACHGRGKLRLGARHAALGPKRRKSPQPSLCCDDDGDGGGSDGPGRGGARASG